MNQLLISLRAKKDSVRAETAYRGADKIEKLRNSLTEYMDFDYRYDHPSIAMVNRAKKALGIK